MFRLEKLEVVHWDFWQRLVLPLAAAIVTIVGPNGSGKTTLLDALRTLLALDCSKKRDYKRYVRRNGEDFCWLRGVVDNRRQPSGKRPFWPPFSSDTVTLACRIEKKGGDWTRHYLIAEGDTPIEALHASATPLGVREYQQVLHGAGLTPAIGQVLSLEQVFGDREVLDRYQEARQHQEATRRELVELEAQLDRLQLKIKNTELDVANYQTWCRLNDDRNRLFGEIRPRLEYHLLGDSILKGSSQIIGMQREWRSLLAEKTALQARRPQAEADLAAAETRRSAALAEEQRAIEAQAPINREAGKLEGLLGERDRLLRLAREAGGNPEVIVRKPGATPCALNSQAGKASSANWRPSSPPSPAANAPNPATSEISARRWTPPPSPTTCWSTWSKLPTPAGRKPSKPCSPPTPIWSCCTANATPKQPLRWAKSIGTAISSSPNAASRHCRHRAVWPRSFISGDRFPAGSTGCSTAPSVSRMPMPVHGCRVPRTG